MGQGLAKVISGHVRSFHIDQIVAKPVPRDLVRFSASNKWLRATLNLRSRKVHVRTGQFMSGHVSLH